MPEKISILKESGETLNSNVVSVFLIPDSQKRYIITTENAVDPHGLTVLHVSEIVDGTLQKVATDDEWSSIKTIMRAIISGNVGTFKYLPAISSIKASGQYSRDISVSASASKQMIDNYAIGEKASEAEATSMPDGNPNGGGVIAPQNIMSQEQVIEPSTIFPTSNPVASADNELIPGIAEVPNDMGASQVVNQVQPMSPVDPGMVNQTPMTPNGMENMIVNPMPEENRVGQNIIVNSVANPEINSMGNLNPGIQVAVPTQVVPSAQIAQEAGMPVTPEVSINPNATPSFAPNASLDEVVAGAQEMFMEGVKNLVQTIQEKVYRDLYAKEAELKNKEAELLQKEQMLNNQLAMMNPSQNRMETGMMNNQIQVQPNMMATTPVVSPMDRNQNMMMNNQMANMGMQPMTMNQMGMMPQSPMPMNGVMGNQQMMQQPLGQMPNGPMNVGVNNDIMQ